MNNNSIRIYSVRTGQKGFASLYSKFKSYERIGKQKGLEITREAALAIRRDTKANIRNSLGSTSGLLVRSAYFRKRSGEPPTYEVGVGAEYAPYHEFGTGIYNLFGKGRTASWVYRSDTDGQYYTTHGVEPKLFFNDALERNLDRFADRLKETYRRSFR